jgi:hypothetical protein
MTADFDSVRELADTVLFEGYMLYPYRADDPKNRIRWQFGVLAPPGFVAADPSEHSRLQTDCLLEGGATEVSVQVRFLHVQRRTVQRASDEGFVDAAALDVGNATYLPWDEAVVFESVTTFDLHRAEARETAVHLDVPAVDETEQLRDDTGAVVGRLVRRREALQSRLSCWVEALPGPYGVRRLRLRLDNLTQWSPNGSAEPDRPAALRHALVAAHLVIAAPGGAFVSLIDPPEWARSYAEGRVQEGVFPVLAGPAGDRSLVLASPIILYDHPMVAPESALQFCDATEMDEMLTLRTLTLTDEEKRLVRGSDTRGAALMNELDSLPPELLDRLHGAIRSMSAVARPAAAASPVAPQAPDEIPPWLDENVDASFHPDTDAVLVGGVRLARGAVVRLRPGARRADAQDMFLEGRRATVEAVLSDLDGGQHLAVSLDDLAEDGVNPHGRYLYFAPDEVEPIGADA